MLADTGGTSAAPRRSTRRSPDAAAAGGVAVAGADGAAAAGAPDAARLKAMDPSNVHVLVVGNLGLDDVSGEPVADVLRASYRVSTAASDAEALQLLRGPGGPGVDLILKEHEPPSCDAVKLLTRLAKTAPLRHIPVVGACPNTSPRRRRARLVRRRARLALRQGRARVCAPLTAPGRGSCARSGELPR